MSKQEADFDFDWEVFEVWFHKVSQEEQSLERTHQTNKS